MGWAEDRRGGISQLAAPVEPTEGSRRRSPPRPSASGQRSLQEGRVCEGAPRPCVQRRHHWCSRESGLRWNLEWDAACCSGLPPPWAVLEGQTLKLGGTWRLEGPLFSQTTPPPATPDSHSFSLLPQPRTSLLGHTHAITHPGAGPGASQTSRYHRRARPDSEKARDSGACTATCSPGMHGGRADPCWE